MLKRTEESGRPEYVPHNIEAEQHLLGEILIGDEQPYWDVAQFLRPVHFYEALHQRIYEVAGELIRAKKVCAAGTIHAYLPADLAIVPGMNLKGYLQRLSDHAYDPKRAEGLGRVIHELAAKRAAIAIGEDLVYQAKRVDKTATVPTLIGRAAAELFELNAEVEDAAIKVASRGWAGVVNDAVERMNSGGSQYRGVSSTLAALDHKLGGVVPGDMLLIGGRPSMGKTALAVTWARRAANKGHGVLFLSYEQGITPIMARFLSDHCEAAGTRIPYNAIDRRMIRPGDVAPLERARDTLASLPLEIVDRGRKLSDVAGHIRAARRKLKEEKGASLDLVVIDQLSHLEASAVYRGDRTREVGELSRGLKWIARDEELPLIVLHQLNRMVEGRKDKRPQLSDLRESGDLEQDADQVLFVYRPAYYLERPGYVEGSAVDRTDMLANVEHDLEVIIAKNRQGATGTAELYCDMATNAVRDKA